MCVKELVCLCLCARDVCDRGVFVSECVGMHVFVSERVCQKGTASLIYNNMFVQLLLPPPSMEGKWKAESLCVVCVCVCERECVCVCEREFWCVCTPVNPFCQVLAEPFPSELPA